MGLGADTTCVDGGWEVSYAWDVVAAFPQGGEVALFSSGHAPSDRTFGLSGRGQWVELIRWAPCV